MKHMKYLIIAVFVILLFTLPAHAADGVGLKVEAAPPQAAPGDRVTMTFSLTDYADGGDLIRGLQLTVSGIDPDVLTVESCRTLITDPSASGKQNLATFQESRGQVNLTYAPLKPANQTTYVPLNGLLEIVLRVADDAQGGSIDLQVQRDIVFQSGTDRNVTSLSAAWSAESGCYDFGAYATDGWNGDYYYENGVKCTGIHAVDGVWYDFGEDGVSKGKYTGLVQDAEGVYHYAKLGAPAGGWFEIDEEWYYFDTETLAPVAEKTFTYPNSKAVTTYQFHENGKIVDGVWVELSAGTRYYYGPDFCKLTAKTGNVWFADVHGVTYGFNGSGFRYEGLNFVKQSNNPQYLANFADDGAYLGPYTGIYEGSYYEDGLVAKLGKMVKLDDTYYYITQQGKVFTSGTLYMTEAMTNGYFAAGSYTFDENGALVLKQGVVDGCYYENGELVKGKGLVQVGNDLYFVKQNGAVFVGNGLYVSEAKANGFVAAGSYDFDSEGKMIRKDGVIDGYYYENGSLVKGKGLVKIGNDLYFVKQNGAVFVGSGLYVSEAKANGLMAPGSYDFDENGKMIVKNGVVDGCYYEEGVLVKGKGLVQVGNDLYFVKQNGAVFTNSTLYISAAKANGLVEAGIYRFDAEGRMIRS